MCVGMQRCTDECMEGLVKVYKGTQGAQRYAGCTEVHTGMCRGAWGCTKVGKGTQWCSEMHGGMHRLQRGTQRCVEVHRGYRGVCRATQRGV